MFRLLSTVFIGIILIWSIEGGTPQKFIIGKVYCSVTKSIDKTTQLKVFLKDVTVTNTKQKVIASVIIPGPQTFPVSYKLPYNSSDLLPKHSYAVSAQVTDANQKIFLRNDLRNRVDLSILVPSVDITIVKFEGSSKSSVKRGLNTKQCSPLKCSTECPYGFQKVNGCQICKCYDPCNPNGKAVLCGSKQRCFVEELSDGTYIGTCGVTSSTVSSPSQTTQADLKVNCGLPPLSGKCQNNFGQFFYNSTIKQCEKFTAEKCGVNGNSFKTKEECQSICVS